MIAVPSRKVPTRTAAVLIVAVLLATLGCSPLPLAPRVSEDGAKGGPASAGLTQIAEISPKLPVEPVDPPEDGDVVASRIVSGTVGAVITTPSISLQIPPGAINGTAEVRVTIPDSTKLHCYLEISGGAPNHFEVPVVLTFDCRNVTDIEHQGVFWYDEENERWMQIAGDIDRDRKIVTTPLTHFSQYKCEKTKLAKASW